MPRETHATIHPSFLPPPPIEDHPQPFEPAPGISADDFTTSGPQTADQVAAGAKGERKVVAPAVAANRREAEGG